MSGIESLLLIIIGILGIASSSYINSDGDIVEYGFKTALIKVFTIYGVVSFLAGNIFFVIWLIR